MVSFLVSSASSMDVSVLCSALEMRQAVYLGRELARLGAAVHATGRGELPWGPLHLQNCECSPLAQLSVWPSRGQRELASPPGASGERELARVESQSHAPSAGPVSLSAPLVPSPPGPPFAALYPPA